MAGNLEVIARVGDRLVGFFRPDQPPFQWQPASASAFIGAGGGATQRGDLVVSGICDAGAGPPAHQPGPDALFGRLDAPRVVYLQICSADLDV